jgi:hypothetical protein
MINFALSIGDIQGDMVAPASDDLSLDGHPSASLKIGSALYSPGNGFRFVLQTDGNAVVQVVNNATLPRIWLEGTPFSPDSVDWIPLWASGTTDQGVIQLDMQDDGNCVIYNDSGPIWSSQSANNPGAFLRMQDDGNLVVYSNTGEPLWLSGTAAQSRL